MSEAVGIKETKEVIVAVGLVKNAVQKVFADGKVSLDDASAIVELATHAKELTDAIDNASAVKGELKDLDNAEAKELLLSLIDLIVPSKKA